MRDEGLPPPLLTRHNTAIPSRWSHSLTTLMREPHSLIIRERLISRLSSTPTHPYENLVISEFDCLTSELGRPTLEGATYAPEIEGKSLISN